MTEFYGYVTSCLSICPVPESSLTDTTPTLEVESAYRRRRSGDMRMGLLKLFHGYAKTLLE